MINHRIHRAGELKAYMTESTRTRFSNAYLFSLINYGAPLMYNSCGYVKDKMHSLHMICSRFSRGNYGFRVSCRTICRDIGKKPSNEEFEDNCFKFAHHIIYHQLPKSIISKIKLPRTRSTANIGLRKYPKNKKFKSTWINKIPEVYNCIPDNLRRVKPHIFKKKLKKITIRRQWNLKLRLPRGQKHSTALAVESVELIYIAIKFQY